MTYQLSKPTGRMSPVSVAPSRRQFLRNIGLATTLLTVPGAFAEELTRKKTSGVEEGPFYPPQLPLDTDNDLLIVNNSITPAVGEVTHLSGRLLDGKGEPIRNAQIEIWQVDHEGTYFAERSNRSRFDSHFQGFGRFLTGATGEYYFRTIKPVVYPGRQAPHIHFKIKAPRHESWTTQLFVKGHPGNVRDPLWTGIREEEARASVTMDFVPLKNSSSGELAARFDIILGVTKEEQAD